MTHLEHAATGTDTVLNHPPLDWMSPAIDDPSARALLSSAAERAGGRAEVCIVREHHGDNEDAGFPVIEFTLDPPSADAAEIAGRYGLPPQFVDESLQLLAGLGYLPGSLTLTRSDTRDGVTSPTETVDASQVRDIAAYRRESPSDADELAAALDVYFRQASELLEWDKALAAGLTPGLERGIIGKVSLFDFPSGYAAGADVRRFLADRLAAIAARKALCGEDLERFYKLQSPVGIHVLRDPAVAAAADGTPVIDRRRIPFTADFSAQIGEAEFKEQTLAWGMAVRPGVGEMDMVVGLWAGSPECHIRSVGVRLEAGEGNAVRALINGAQFKHENTVIRDKRWVPAAEMEPLPDGERDKVKEYVENRLLSELRRQLGGDVRTYLLHAANALFEDRELALATADGGRTVRFESGWKGADKNLWVTEHADSKSGELIARTRKLLADAGLIESGGSEWPAAAVSFEDQDLKAHTVTAQLPPYDPSSLERFYAGMRTIFPALDGQRVESGRALKPDEVARGLDETRHAVARQTRHILITNGVFKGMSGDRMQKVIEPLGGRVNGEVGGAIERFARTMQMVFSFKPNGAPPQMDKRKAAEVKQWFVQRSADEIAELAAWVRGEADVPACAAHDAGFLAPVVSRLLFDHYRDLAKPEAGEVGFQLQHGLMPDVDDGTVAEAFRQAFEDPATLKRLIGAKDKEKKLPASAGLPAIMAAVAANVPPRHLPEGVN